MQFALTSAIMCELMALGRITVSEVRNERAVITVISKGWERGERREEEGRGEGRGGGRGGEGREGRRLALL